MLELSNEQLSLARQIDLVFKELETELAGLSSGTVFVQIRNNTVGKFGIRHNPITGRDGQLKDEANGLNGTQVQTFRGMAIEALKYKKYWTHGEISYEFALRKGEIVVDATLESNYNMANLMIRYPRNNSQRTYGELKDLS